MIKSLVDHYAGKALLAKPLVTLFEDVPDFWVAEDQGAIVGCGAVHVLWEDLGEIRTVAVAPNYLNKGVGHRIVSQLIEVAREFGLTRIFVLTFETRFFSKHGFVEITG